MKERSPDPIHLLTVLFFLMGSAQDVLGQPSQKVDPGVGQAVALDYSGMSARVAVLGDAFTSVADDSSALFVNPAGLASLGRGEVSVHSHLGSEGLVQGTAVLGLPGRWGGVGFSCGYLSYGNLEGRDVLGNLTPSYGADRMGAQAGLGILLASGLSVGSAVQYSRQGIVGEVYSYLAPSLGILFSPLKDWKVGASYLHPLSLQWAGPMVTSLKCGTSLTAALDPSTRFLGALGVCVQSNSFNTLQGGIEASHQAKYFLRLGYQLPLKEGSRGELAGFSAGGGIDLAGLQLDYAFLSGGDLGSSHRFSVTYPFKETPTKGSVLGSGPTFSNDQGQMGKTTTSVVLSTGLAGNSNSLFQTDPLSQSVNPSSVTQGSQEPPKVDTQEAPKDSLTLHFALAPDPLARGEALEAQGKHAEAIQLFQEVLKGDPGNAQAWWDLGNAYAKTGQKSQAIQSFERVLGLKPGQKALRDWLEKYRAQQP